MIGQRTLASVVYDTTRKVTRRERFFAGDGPRDSVGHPLGARGAARHQARTRSLADATRDDTPVPASLGSAPAHRADVCRRARPAVRLRPAGDDGDHRRCDVDRGAELDEECYENARSRDATDAEGDVVALWHAVSHRDRSAGLRAHAHHDRRRAVGQLPALVHGFEETRHGDQAYWKEADREAYEALNRERSRIFFARTNSCSRWARSVGVNADGGRKRPPQPRIGAASARSRPPRTSPTVISPAQLPTSFVLVTCAELP